MTTGKIKDRTPSGHRDALRAELGARWDGAGRVNLAHCGKVKLRWHKRKVFRDGNYRYNDGCWSDLLDMVSEPVAFLALPFVVVRGIIRYFRSRYALKAKLTIDSNAGEGAHEWSLAIAEHRKNLWVAWTSNAIAIVAYDGRSPAVFVTPVTLPLPRFSPVTKTFFWDDGSRIVVTFPKWEAARLDAYAGVK